MSALKSLTIEHLRGSVVPFKLLFESGKKLTVVYGENGTGKSTISDALDFLGNGKVGSIEGRGLGATRPFWPSLGCAPASVSVTLETSDATCRAKMQGVNVAVAPAAARPKVKVLRRSQVLSLIQATAADRYTEIKAFIDVTAVEAAETALRTLIRGLDTDRGRAVAVIGENNSEISRLWVQAGRPIPDREQWAAQESVVVTSELQAEEQAIARLRTSYTKLANQQADWTLAQQNLTASESALAAAEVAASAAAQAIAANAAETLAILEAASHYFDRHGAVQSCPLCESAENAAKLAGDVRHKLDTLTALRTAQSQLQAAQTKHSGAQSRMQSLADAATRALTEYQQQSVAADLPKDLVLPALPVSQDLPDLSRWLDETATHAAQWATQQGSRHDRALFVGAVSKAHTARAKNIAVQKDLDTTLPRLNRALKIMEEERRSYTDGVLASIAKEVGRLYEAVHPGEGLDKISLALDPNQRASLVLGTSFEGQNTPPGAYLSDSHLDTLGLCVFLALAALENPSDIILVLDDVLGSVDEPHVDRLINLLQSETSRFRHCLITTHYGPWRHKLRWGWLKSHPLQFIELTKWDSKNGLKLIRSVPEVERLRELLQQPEPDLQAICSKAGVVLEAALDFLTLHYQCAVPRRLDGRYTLGELLPAIKPKLRAALTVDVLQKAEPESPATYSTVALGVFLDELARVAQVRNAMGCHFSSISYDLLDSDAIGFGQQVLSLLDALTDSEAGWPKNDKSGNYWETRGSTRRLRPFQTPG